MSTKYWAVSMVGLASLLLAACASDVGTSAGGAEPCVLNGVTYQPGQSFRCDCNSCQCVGGNEIVSTTMWCGDAGSGGSAGAGGNPSGTGGTGGVPTTAIVPPGQALTGFRLGWIGPLVGNLDSSSTCDPSSFQNSIVVNVRDSSIGWNRCAEVSADPSSLVFHAAPVQGQRPLDASELASILAAFQGVEIGSESACPSDLPIKTLDVQTDQALLLYVSDESACLASVAERASVVHLNGLIYALNPMVPAGP
jgi:hypothetical protein